MKKNINSLMRKFIISGVIALAGITDVIAGTASTNLTFTTTFIGGGCVVSGPSFITFNNGEPLLAADIEAATEAGTPKTSATFEITLSECQGWGLIPKIKVSGDKTTAFGSTLFRSSALGPEDSDGYGVYLNTPGNNIFNSNNNLATNSDITVKGNWKKEDQLSGINSTLPMFAVLRCGSCTYEGRHGGKFQANVTFDLIYE